MSTPAFSLPALNQTVLDWTTLDALFRDLAACTEIVSVTTRAAVRATGVPPTAITLEQARAGLSTSTMKAVQIRYRHEGQIWCDTLMAAPQGVRLVRISEADVMASVSAPAA